MLRPGDRIAIVANSDGLGEPWVAEVDRLRKVLSVLGLDHSTGLPIDRAYGEGLAPPTAHPAPDRDRAEHLMEVLENPEVSAVFDVSGGELATGVLTYLDPARLARTTGFFMGFSNLTTIANALYVAGGVPSLLANPRLIGSDDGVRADFAESCIVSAAAAGPELPARPGSPFVAPQARIVRGASMSGTVVGGNLTALLSLAGTPWFPLTDGAIIAIEALSPSYTAVSVGLHQLRQMGAFDRAAGILLGQFTAVDSEYGPDAVPRLACEIIPDLPIGTTRHFGHSPDSRALTIGADLSLASTSPF